MNGWEFFFYGVVDALGLLGAILVALPFLREEDLKSLRNALEKFPRIRGLEKAMRSAGNDTAAELGRFDPRDRSNVVAGLIAIGASYALHIVVETVVYFHRGS